MQQAFLSAFAAIESGAEVRHLRGWLHRITRNAAIRSHRPPDASLDGIAAGGEPLEDVVAQRAMAVTALSELGRLPRRQRDALVGTALHGRGRAELAMSMGLSEGAVRQLVHRARMAMRTAVTALIPYPLARWFAAAPLDRGVRARRPPRCSRGNRRRCLRRGSRREARGACGLWRPRDGDRRHAGRAASSPSACSARRDCRARSSGRSPRSPSRRGARRALAGDGGRDGWSERGRGKARGPRIRSGRRWPRPNRRPQPIAGWRRAARRPRGPRRKRGRLRWRRGRLGWRRERLEWRPR